MKKIAIVTGANGGIGQHYSREMLNRGYHVVLACRSKASGEKVLKQLKSEFPNETVELLLVDMGDLKSIKQFSNTVLSKYSRLDVLAHNAGVYFFDKEKRTSKDGIELNLAIHFIGPFALTAQLFSLLQKTPDARVVSMSSSEHRGNPIDVNDIQSEKDFSEVGNMKVYSRSKWAILAFTAELNRRIQTKNLNIHALGAHPGVSITGIQHAGNPNFLQKGVIWMIGKFFAGKPEDAAKPLIMASVEGQGGEFYGPTGFNEFKGKPGIVQPDEGTKNQKIGATLWEKAEKLSNLTFDV
ncbi:MAG: SDR family NAD(P)-dependent oxidoreductase [Saprospiraceae bacterium]